MNKVVQNHRCNGYYIYDRTNIQTRPDFISVVVFANKKIKRVWLNKSIDKPIIDDLSFYFS